MSMPATPLHASQRPTLTSMPTGFLGRAADAGGPSRRLLEAATPKGPLTVDIAVYDVRLAGGPVALSPRQVELLAVFLAAPGKVWSREQLHWICWGDTAPSRRVDVQLCRIRGKVGTDLFRNVRDRGWTLQLP